MEKSIDVNELERALEKNKDAVVVTLVHCDTSSALLNSLSKVVKMIRHYGSLLIVDAVLCIGGILIGFDDDIDTLVGSSEGAKYSSRTDIVV